MATKNAPTIDPAALAAFLESQGYTVKAPKAKAPKRAKAKVVDTPPKPQRDKAVIGTAEYLCNRWDKAKGEKVPTWTPVEVVWKGIDQYTNKPVYRVRFVGSAESFKARVWNTVYNEDGSPKIENNAFVLVPNPKLRNVVLD